MKMFGILSLTPRTFPKCLGKLPSPLITSLLGTTFSTAKERLLALALIAGLPLWSYHFVESFARRWRPKRLRNIFIVGFDLLCLLEL